MRSVRLRFWLFIVKTCCRCTTYPACCAGYYWRVRWWDCRVYLTYRSPLLCWLLWIVAVVGTELTPLLLPYDLVGRTLQTGIVFS